MRNILFMNILFLLLFQGPPTLMGLMFNQVNDVTCDNYSVVDCWLIQHFSGKKGRELTALKINSSMHFAGRIVCL